MKAIVDATEFSQALNKVIKVIKVNKKSVCPELEGVLVQIEDGRCTLRATDFTTWLTTVIPAQGDDVGFVLWRPKDAAQACCHFQGELILETEEKIRGKNRCIQLTMFCEPRCAQIMALLPEDYPAMAEHQSKYIYTVNAARLLERVEHVKYTLYKPDPGIRAQGTHVQFDGNKVFALDGLRMAWDIDDGLTVRQPFMVLPEALEYLKFFGNQDITVSMGVNYLKMTDGATVIQTRIEGPPVFNMDKAVPTEFTEEFYICPKDFLGELDYLKKLLLKTDKPYIYFSNGRLSMAAASGNYNTQVQIDGESSIGFGFDLRYMVDAIQQFRGESFVKMKVISSVAPVILEAEGRSDCAMILPVRMKEAAAA